MPDAIIQERVAEVAERLAGKTVMDANGCHLWTGYTQPNGYGWLSIRGHKIAAHRAALIVSGVDVPRHMDVCHKCDVRNCINPAHLYVGTRRQNMADCSLRKRHNKPKGAAHWCAKLSDDQVRAIRKMREYGSTTTSIAQAFSIHPATVSRIVRHVWRKEVA